MCHNTTSNLPDEAPVVVTSFASWPPPIKMWYFGSFEAVYSGEMAASLSGLSVSYSLTHSYSSSIVQSLAVWSLEQVIIRLLSSEKFRLVIAPLCAWKSWIWWPFVASQMTTVPSSKIETSVSSNGPHFTLVAFMGSSLSMDSTLLQLPFELNFQTMILFGTEPSFSLLNLSLHVTTKFCAPGFWLNSTNFRMPPCWTTDTCSPSKV
mmetsp:Transcript_29276/g.83199  ORF Transcript_29276/g.83199 Transcript_29276/m.83199 type:complete len:207 (-) Transcript_29276:306-926(-)